QFLARDESVCGQARNTACGQLPRQRLLAGHLERLIVGDDERRDLLASEVQTRHLGRLPHVQELGRRRSRSGGDGGEIREAPPTHAHEALRPQCAVAIGASKAAVLAGTCGSQSTFPLSSEYTAPTTTSSPRSTWAPNTGFETRICRTTFSTLIRTALS